LQSFSAAGNVSAIQITDVAAALAIDDEPLQLLIFQLV
jgi:hypothetical protein